MLNSANFEVDVGQIRHFQVDSIQVLDGLGSGSTTDVFQGIN